MSKVDRREVEVAVAHLLVAIGEDRNRPGIVDTPARVARFWEEFMEGADGTFDRVFPDAFDQMVILRNIRFYSLCEHHLLPFFGTAAVAYIPNGEGVLGLSKLARIVRKHAQRLQVQERMTQDIAAEVQHATNANGVGVSVTALHLCAAMRGIRSTDSEFVTNVVTGAMRDEPAARAEFFDAVRKP